MAKTAVRRNSFGERFAKGLGQAASSYATLQQNRNMAPKIRQILSGINPMLGGMVNESGMIHPLADDLLDYYGTANTATSGLQKILFQEGIKDKYVKQRDANEFAFKLSATREGKKAAKNILKSLGIKNPDLLDPMEKNKVLTRYYMGDVPMVSGNKGGLFNTTQSYNIQYPDNFVSQPLEGINSGNVPGPAGSPIGSDPKKLTQTDADRIKGRYAY